MAPDWDVQPCLRKSPSVDTTLQHRMDIGDRQDWQTGVAVPLSKQIPNKPGPITICVQSTEDAIFTTLYLMLSHMEGKNTPMSEFFSSILAQPLI